MEESNLIETIRDCLQEHEIIWGKEPQYLIEVNGMTNPYQDFVETYAELDDFKKEVARKLLGDEENQESYGVLVNQDLKYDFAFNRRFADLNFEDGKLSFKSPEQVLFELMDQEKGEKKKPNTVKNLLHRIRQVYEDGNKVEIDDKNFFLIPTLYETNLLKDLKRTYGENLDEFKEKLASNLIGESLNKNRYIMLLNEDLQIEYAYNESFAEYNPETMEIEFKPVEESVLEIVEERKDSNKQIKIPGFDIPFMPSRVPSRIDNNTIIRYALIGKK